MRGAYSAVAGSKRSGEALLGDGLRMLMGADACRGRRIMPPPR